MVLKDVTEFRNMQKQFTICPLNALCHSKLSYSFTNDRPRFARSNMENKMVQINYCTRNSEKQLFIRAIRLWSQIPNNIQLLHSSLNNL